MNLVNKKCSLIWITIILLKFVIKPSYGLQGIPSWISLGLKSPFIEFRMETEILSNNSIALNLTNESTDINKKGGTQSMDNYMGKNNHTNTFYLSDTKQQQQQQNNNNNNNNSKYENPMLKENKIDMTEKSLYNYDRQITILDEEKIDDKEHKYILPLALKNPTEEPKRSPLFQESSPNIEDLKKHIMMLQNLTKNDKNFQSKFVVFPNLQKNNTNLLISTIKPKTIMNVPKYMALQSQQFLRDDIRNEKITIVPQVLLQNDQTPMTDENKRLDKIVKNEQRQNYSGKNGKRQNGRKLTTMKTTIKTTTTTTSTTMTPKRTTRKQRRNKSRPCKKRNNNNNNNKNVLCQNQTQLNSTKLLIDTKNLTIINDKQQQQQNLRRVIRRRTAENSILTNSRTYQQQQQIKYDIRNTSKDTTIILSTPSTNIVHQHTINSNETNVYKENIDLNSDLCLGVGGLSHGQQKLCILHTSIMPAVSRGARSAIQECKHQFKNRRWNCSIVEDDTVFGPITSIGSPEMAFVHALAAAGAASFIARACRDGQLASCGCSRGTRPKQLHDDWTWGGCGDDLEFGYKFSQTFIDIKEKERKRGTRGLVSVPPKFPKDMETMNETSETTDTVNRDSSNKFKPEDLLELQEKITKEILNTKLQEKEMHELQAKINREILNSKVFSLENHGPYTDGKKNTNQKSIGRMKGNGGSVKARSLMNLHNNEAGRRAVIKKARITCKCHGVSGSCSLITCWQQLTSIREIGDFLREKYDEATQVKMNKRGRLQVKDPRYKVPSALDLVYLDDSPDWCRNNKQLQWPGTHERICNKTSSGLDGCGILCCGRGYNTKKLVVKERCNCKFHWCCQVKCETCVKVIEEYTCK